MQSTKQTSKLVEQFESQIQWPNDKSDLAYLSLDLMGNAYSSADPKGHAYLSVALKFKHGVRFWNRVLQCYWKHLKVATWGNL